MNTMNAPSAPGARDDDRNNDDDRNDDEELTRQYLDLVRTLHRDWADLEESGDDSVQLQRSTRMALSEAVRADARHGARVQMPPTDLGPYTLTEQALRSLIRDATDGVAGAVSLKTTIDYAPAPGWGTRGEPVGVACRISAAASCPDLLALASSVRSAVTAACALDLDLTDVTVDLHIEDLHDY